jgi:replicative DNA helicase
MSELSVIRHLCSKDFHREHRASVDIEYLSKEIQPVLRTIDAHFELGDDPPSLSVSDLSNLFFSTPRPKAEFYEGVFKAIAANDASEDSTLKLIAGLREAQMLRDISMLAYEASEGRKTASSVLELMQGLSTSDDLCDQDSDFDFVSTDLLELVSTSRDMASLRWRADSLNKRLGGLRKGNFGFVFARPETGKTTFLASEVSFMAEQIPEDKGPILWLNNEQVGTEVMLRIYQATLGLDNVQLLSDLKRNREFYHEKTKDKIKLVDSASISRSQVEKIVSKYEPSLIVFDQIDKIKGFDNDREDLRLGQIYIWARELAKTYCPTIGICQADGSGEGVRWLTMANVANAKTSKQAEADWILGIGKVTEAGYDNLRFMHLSKNKLWGDEDTDPKLRHDRWEMLIDPQRGRFLDL